jgi:hypothetical protein
MEMERTKTMGKNAFACLIFLTLLRDHVAITSSILDQLNEETFFAPKST